MGLDPQPPCPQCEVEGSSEGDDSTGSENSRDKEDSPGCVCFSKARTYQDRHRNHGEASQAQQGTKDHCATALRQEIVAHWRRLIG